jgi:hypothetical protein
MAHQCSLTHYPGSTWPLAPPPAKSHPRGRDPQVQIYHRSSVSSLAP